MISILSGTIAAKTKNSVVVATAGGVGYDVRMTPLALTKYAVGAGVTLHTYLKVSDSALDLYGFETTEDRAFFELLMTVSGVGPKTAQNILSLGTVADLQSAIARGDVKHLTAVSGLGKKTAERLVVELKSKIIGHVSDVKGQMSDVVAEVIDALESMGYAREDAKQVVLSLDATSKTTEALLRMALQAMR